LFKFLPYFRSQRVKSLALGVRLGGHLLEFDSIRW